jgi:uncharacterized membrane protein YfcA
MTAEFSYIAVFLAGFISSFINIMAGGGSALTLGILMLSGLDPAVANGTNRIGLLVAGLSGAAAYKSENLGNAKESLWFGLAALPGAVLGSIFAIQVDKVIFERLLALVIIFVAITLFIKPPVKYSSSRPGRKYARIWIYPVMFFIGLYGGFIQAGVGFLIMASLRHMLAMDLVTVNMHKNLIVLFYTIPVLFIFGLTGNIQWAYAGILALGNALGAWLSVKVSVKKGEKIVKAALGAALLLMAVKFFLSF